MLIKNFWHIPRDTDGTWKIGNKEVDCDGDHLIIGEWTYAGTRGLWELIVSSEPDDEIYDADDLANYSEIMIDTNTMRMNNDPEDPRPKSSIVTHIWDKHKASFKGQGTKTIVIPSYK